MPLAAAENPFIRYKGIETVALKIKRTADPEVRAPLHRIVIAIAGVYSAAFLMFIYTKLQAVYSFVFIFSQPRIKYALLRVIVSCDCFSNTEAEPPTPTSIHDRNRSALC